MEHEMLDIIKRAYALYKPIRDLYDYNGVKIQENIDFFPLPFIDKSWLCQYAKIQDKIAVDLEEIAHVFTTSGTTTSPQYVAYTKADWDTHIEVLKDSFLKIGIRKKDVFYDLIL